MQDCDCVVGPRGRSNAGFEAVSRNIASRATTNVMGGGYVAVSTFVPNEMKDFMKINCVYILKQILIFAYDHSCKSIQGLKMLGIGKDCYVEV